MTERTFTMPAPNIATLYDFESAYEDPIRNYFLNVNVGGQVFAQVVTPRTNLNVAAFLITPRLQVKMSMTGLGADGGGVKEDYKTAGNAATNYYSYYQGQLTLDVITSRSNASQSHGLLRGAVRQGMLEATAILNNTSVPYYETPFVNPGGSVQGVDMDNDEIQTQLTYGIDIFIPPASWPNA